MNKEDSIHLWFKFLQERGEYTSISAFEENRLSGEIMEHDFFHGDIDGIGSFLHLMNKYEKAHLLLPELIKRRDPPAWVYVINFLRYLKRLPIYSQSWALGPTDWKLKKGMSERPGARAFKQLSRKDTLLFWNRAREQKVGRNAFLLYHLNSALTPYQKNVSSWKRYWLIPVNLRSDFNSDSGGNRAGFIDACLTHKTSVQDLHWELKRSLLRGEAYGGYSGITIGRFLGENLLKVLVNLNDYIQVRTGVFTNLGNWKTVEGRDLGANWYGLPPVIRSQPFGAMTGSMNEEQSLALHFHPFLTRSEVLARECLDRWIEGLLSG